MWIRKRSEGLNSKYEKNALFFHLYLLYSTQIFPVELGYSCYFCCSIN